LTLKEARRFLGQTSPVPRAPNLQSPIPDTEPVVELQDVWFSYNSHPALKGVSLTIRRGELVAIMGRNGSGKTTLLKHLVGLLRPQEGRVALFGHDIRHEETEFIVRRVGYVPQNPNALLFADSVRQEVEFTRRSHRLPPDGETDLLATLGLAGLADAYPRDLSAGERQRVALAAILAAGPEILLLDEPTRGLDYWQKQALVGYLRAQKAGGRTTLLVTHDVELVAACADRVVILGDGQIIVDGPTRQVMTQSLVFSSQVNKLYRDPRALTVADLLD